MPNKHRLIYIAILSALATACSTGSNLNTGNHKPVTNIPGTGGNDNSGNTGGNDNSGNTGGNEPAKTNFATISDSEVQKANSSTDDGKTEEPAPEPEYGYSLPSPFTGGYTHAILSDEQKQLNASIDTNNAHTETNADNYDNLTFVNNPENQSNGKTRQVNITKSGFTSNAYDYNPDPETAEGTISEKIKDNLILVVDGDTFETLKMVEFDHTKAGAVFSGQDPKYANIFYRGKNASELLPSSGTAKYDGLWEVVRKVDINPGEAVAGYAGDNFNSRAPVDLTVDFSNKTIYGNFLKNMARGNGFGYKLTGGTIKGNTFSGKATSTTDNKETNVTGGFFGEQGSELAGKLLNDETFGVFAAKQTSNEELVDGEEQPKTIYNQTKAITADTRTDNIFTTNFTEILAGTEKLPNIDKITINGVDIDLVTEVKKSPSSVFGNEDSLPLQFTRIGGINGKTQDTFSFFYQGQLTQTMPETGSANYKGNWIGYGKAETGTPFSMNKDSNAKINFTADFANKALSGKFLTPTGNDAMTLNDVKITGNTFAGQANITNSGLVNDRDGTQGRVKGSVNLSGGFFGDNANELGGQFSKEDNSFAGVFAGKKTTDK